MESVKKLKKLKKKELSSESYHPSKLGSAWMKRKKGEKRREKKKIIKKKNCNW